MRPARRIANDRALKRPKCRSGRKATKPPSRNRNSIEKNHEERRALGNSWFGHHPTARMLCASVIDRAIMPRTPSNAGR